MGKNYYSVQDLAHCVPLVDCLLSDLDKNLRPAEFVSSYILTWIRSTDSNWNMGPLKNTIRFYFDHEDLNVFATSRVRKISHFINQVLMDWAFERFHLHLTFEPLTPLEVLDFQCLGQRCVTCVLPPTKLDQYVLGERDPLSFCLHDLMHAHHFFSEPLLLDAQIGFSKVMKASIREGVFKNLYEAPEFQARFEYAYSDMNGHPIHLLKYLRAVVDETKDFGYPSEKYWSDFVGVGEAMGLSAKPLYLLNREEDPKNLEILTEDLKRMFPTCYQDEESQFKTQP